jgi:hypothetical protein
VALQAWARLSALVIVVMVVGLMGFFASAFLAGYYGGID